MAKASQLPSGSWRVRVYDKETGKRISFTSKQTGKAGKAEAELFAREYQLGKRRKAEGGLTIGECIDEYIALKEHILSPSTLDGYRRIKNNSLAELCRLPVSSISEKDIQAHINRLALSKSPKTIRNAHGLLVSVLNAYAPDLHIRTTLPKPKKHIKQLPAVADVLRAVKGSDIELPCLLAIWCSLRMSEIRGAKRSNISGGILTVKDTIITVDGENIERDTTKTVESTRRLRLPAPILSLIDALPADQDYLVTYTHSQIYKRFIKLLDAAGVQRIAFHDLRHLCASVMLALGIPDKYAMERGGWSTNTVMKSVYQHTFSAERQAADDKIDEYFSGLYDAILDTAEDTAGE